MIEVGEIEEQQGRGRKHHNLEPKYAFSDPIHPPVGQCHRCQERREVASENDEENIRDVVARDPNQGSTRHRRWVVKILPIDRGSKAWYDKEATS